RGIGHAEIGPVEPQSHRATRASPPFRTEADVVVADVPLNRVVLLAVVDARLLLDLAVVATRTFDEIDTNPSEGRRIVHHEIGREEPPVLVVDDRCTHRERAPVLRRDAPRMADRDS